MKENSLYDKKSLKEITGKSADWNEVAKDCVAFSNAQGGIIDYGIEDDAEEPMPNQRVPEELVVTLQNKINNRTSNVNAYGEILTHSNGGQYLRLHISRGSSAASTTSGKFFIRVSDNSVPVVYSSPRGAKPMGKIPTESISFSFPKSRIEFSNEIEKWK